MGSAGGVRAPCTNRRLQSNHLPAFSLMWRRGGETHRSEGWAHKGKPAYSGHYPNAVDVVVARGRRTSGVIVTNPNRYRRIENLARKTEKDRNTNEQLTTRIDDHVVPASSSTRAGPTRPLCNRACANTHDPNDAVTQLHVRDASVSPRRDEDAATSETGTGRLETRRPRLSPDAGLERDVQGLVSAILDRRVMPQTHSARHSDIVRPNRWLRPDSDSLGDWPFARLLLGEPCCTLMHRSSRRCLPVSPVSPDDDAVCSW